MEESNTATNAKAGPVRIILVEDDDGHATLIQRNLRRAGLVNAVVHLHDGQELVDLLLNPDGKRAPPPEASLLVLLDLRMAGLDGIETLRWLRSTPAMARVPVVVLTTTDDPREIAQCYDLGCNVFMTKPVSYEAFAEAVHRLGLFLQVVKLPAIQPLREARR